MTYLATVPLPGVCDCDSEVEGFHWPACASHQPIDVCVELERLDEVPDDAISVEWREAA